MNRSALPEAAFVAPTGDNTDEVRELVGSVVDRLYTLQSDAADRSPLPDEPSVPDHEIPERPRTVDGILGDVERIVRDSMNPAHPGYIGHMDTIPSTISALGDLVAAAINNNLLSVEMSPVLSRLEVRLTEAIAAEFGLGPDAGGVLASGGSLATLQALAVARNRAVGTDGSGLAGLDREPVVFASAASHTSLRKAAMLLGLGSDALVPVETDDRSRMRPSALEAAIDEAMADGRAPFCVVGTAGTTTTGNIDPLAELGEIADRADLWFHVDAAYGGALAFADRERDRLAGIETADSITFNPQKWWYVAKTCAMALFADADVLEEQFRVGAPYMRAGTGISNLGELSVQGTRHADVLKLWLSLQHLGRTGLTQLIEEGYRLTEIARGRVADREELELASEPETNIVCFRAAPEWCPEEARDDLNGHVQRHLLEERAIFVSLPTYRDARWLRVVLLNPYSDEATIDRLFAGIDECLDAARP